jgi:hypothetical protein
MADISIYMWVVVGDSLSFTDVIPYAPFSDSPDGTKSWITINESMAGIATCDLQMWDLNLAFMPTIFSEIKIVDNVAGHNLFWGLVQTITAEPIATYRIWKIHAVDWNWVLPVTLVGVPDGGLFEGDGTENGIVMVDPGAQVYGGSDAANVAHLFANYWQCGIVIPNTSTFVETINTQIGYPDPIYWDRIDMRQGLNDICSLSGPYTQSWIDMDGCVHLTAFGPVPPPTNVASPTHQPLPSMFPAFTPNAYVASSGLTDGPADHVTTFNYENFSVEQDASGWAFSVYVRGATDYTWTPLEIPTGSGNWVPTKIVIGGTGWVGLSGDGGSSWASRYVDAPAVTTHAQRNAAGMAAVQNMIEPLIKGSCDVTAPGIAYHAGQMISVENYPTGVNGSYPIQQVTTSLVGGNDLRRCSLQWGSAQFGNLGLRASQTRATVPSKGAMQFVVTADAYAAHTAQTVALTAQLVNSNNDPWAIQNIATSWHVMVVDDSDADVTGTTTFTLTPLALVTNAAGQVQATLLLDASATGVQYQVTVTSP